ncbi:hypothetical protein HDE_13326 [Halotydeus destructor]|nr:hypothetical protein HDE_13326 [Halotydeus destructor]
MASIISALSSYKDLGVSQGIFTGQSSSLLNPASTTVEIPLHLLKDVPVKLAQEVNTICAKTQTHILFEHREDYVSYLIYGKWRNCLTAARRLWYNLVKDYILHINGSWQTYLTLATHDQKCAKLSSLYSSLTCEVYDDFNCIAIKGPYWNVLKFGRELISRSRLAPLNDDLSSTGGPVMGFSGDAPSANATATDILKKLKIDFRDDSPASEPSSFVISDGEMLQLIFGPKSRKSEPKKPVMLTAKAKVSHNWFKSVYNDELGLDKLEQIELPCQSITRRYI